MVVDGDTEARQFGLQDLCNEGRAPTAGTRRLGALLKCSECPRPARNGCAQIALADAIARTNLRGIGQYGRPKRLTAADLADRWKHQVLRICRQWQSVLHHLQP